MSVADAIADLVDVVDLAKTFHANYTGTYAGIISSQLGAPTEDDYAELENYAKAPAGARRAFALALDSLREGAIIVLRDIAREINRGDLNPAAATPTEILRALRTWMVDNSKVFESRAVTHNAVSSLTSPLTSGADCELVMHTTDDQATADSLEAITSDTLRFECVQDQGGGSSSGEEKFAVWASVGQPALDILDYPVFSQRLQLAMVSAATARGLENANFEQDFISSGTTGKIPSWTLDSNHANVVAETTTKYRGSQALKLNGAVVISQAYKLANVTGPVIFSLRYNRSAGSGAGTLVIRGGGKNTSVSQLSLASSGWQRLSMIHWPKRFSGSGFDCEIELTTTGEAISGYTLVDEVVVHPLTRIGGRFFILLAGQTDPAIGDYFTQASSITGTGLIKDWLHRWFGNEFELPHDGTASVGWEDPT